MAEVSEVKRYFTVGTRRRARRSGTERTGAAGLFAPSRWGNWCCGEKLAPS